MAPRQDGKATVVVISSAVSIVQKVLANSRAADSRLRNDLALSRRKSAYT